MISKSLIQQRKNQSLNSVKSGKIKKLFSEEERDKIVIEGQSGEVPIKELCNREGISLVLFYNWSNDFIKLKKTPVNKQSSVKKFSQDEKFKIVLEGLNGEFTIAQICRKEKIKKEQFLLWSKDFLRLKNKLSENTDRKINKVCYQKVFDENKISKKVIKYYKSFISFSQEDTEILSDLNIYDKIENFKLPKKIIYIDKINTINDINNFFVNINKNLQNNGLFIGNFEPIHIKKNILKQINFKIKRLNASLISEAEVLGRLVFCGFKIIDFKNIGGNVYFVARKESNSILKKSLNTSLILKMPRLTKDGNTFHMYKLRTMYPYSEYLQDYIIKSNGYGLSGKPNSDFRITPFGKFLRKYWIDELPQLINILKGEMNLVGVRPVSKRFFEDIPKEIQKIRSTQKPGCIPPYIALNSKSDVMSILQAEIKYISAKGRSPYFTNLNYFLKAIYNIVFKHRRSA